MESENKIEFYQQYKPFGFMSNFYDSPFTVGDKVYKTNQHYFQSKKYEGHPEQQLVIDSPTPHEAFKLGQKQQYPRRQDWQSVKEGIMYEGLKYKFGTHKNLYQRLMETGNKTLVQHTKNDKYWADGGDGSGRNRLGVLLMKLRQQYKNVQ